MTQIAEWLAGSFSPDSNLVRESTKKLEEAYATNFPLYVSELARIHLDLAGAQNLRYAAGIAFKNAIVANDSSFKTTKAALWNNMPPQIKTQIKSSMLGNLGSVVGSQTAQVVSAIASIEIPVNGWPNLIDELLVMVVDSNSSVQLKSNSITALGYICEVVDSSYLSAHSDRILTALANGSRQDQPGKVRKLALEALHQALPFVRSNFLLQNERDIIMTILCECSTFHSDDPSHQSVGINVSALQCISSIFDLYYELTPPYIRTLYSITLTAMTNPEEEIALQAIDIWTTLCEKELELIMAEAESRELKLQPAIKCMNYANDVLVYLTPALFNILSCQREDMDDDEWCPAMAAATCLMALSRCTGANVLTSALGLIEEGIKSPDWHKRDAAIMGFGCIIEGPDPDTMAQLASKALGFIVPSLEDPKMVIRETVIWTLGRLCEFTGDRLELAAQTEIVKSLLWGLKQQVKISAQSCLGLHNFADHFERVARYSETHATSPFFVVVVDELLAIALASMYNDDLRTVSHAALASWICAAANDCIYHVRMVASKLVPNFQKALQAGTRTKEYFEYLSAQLVVLNALIKRLDDDVRVNPKSISELLTSVMAISNSCDQIDSSSMKEDLLMCIGSLANVLAHEFAAFSGEYLDFAIQTVANIEDPSVCSAGVGVLSDICCALGSDFAGSLERVMKVLGATLTNSAASMSIKPRILTCFGDLALNTGAAAMAPYLHVIMTTLQQALVAIDNLPSDAEYVEQLNESIVEALTGIVNTFSTTNIEKMLPYVKFIENVAYRATLKCSQMATKSLIPERLLCDIAGILGDLAHGLPSDYAMDLKAQWTTDFLATVVSATSLTDETRRTAGWALDKIRSIMI